MQLVLKETSGPLPTTVFELKDKGKLIGMLQFRHRASKSREVPEGFENHIYYEIEPKYRKSGYGTKILALGLEEARRINLPEVILTCKEDNIASQKIIKSNGGLLVDKKANLGETMMYKYKISLS